MNMIRQKRPLWAFIFVVLNGFHFGGWAIHAHAQSGLQEADVPAHARPVHIELASAADWSSVSRQNPSAYSNPLETGSKTYTSNLTSAKNSTNTNSKISSTSSTVSVIQAFEEICLKTAPSFSKAMVVSADYGILDFIQFGEVLIGATEDSNISLELIANKECVVSSKKLKDDQLVEQFQQKVAQLSDEEQNLQPVSKDLHLPFVVKLNGQHFVFQHSREEGETFQISNVGG